MSDLLRLAERCEQATGPDRELDADIYMAADAERGSFQTAYTASLDAAMTLVPEGWRMASMGETVIEGNDPWNVRLLEKRFDMRGGRSEGDAATPALALCAAAIRARDAA